MPTMTGASKLFRSLILNVDVPDVEAATQFYVETFGLVVGRRLGAVGVELLGAGVPIYLLAKPEGSEPFAGAGAGRTYARHWTPVHMDFEVNDIHAARARAVANGASTEGEVSEQAFGLLALLTDPFGHGLCLIEFRGRGYDALV